ncbi:MAG: hypothetical protein R2911_25385 [Caldilineaceae bacterium]
MISPQTNSKMSVSIITREQVIELVRAMPMEKLARWYEYGLFIQAHPLFVPAPPQDMGDDELLRQEISEWEMASDEDWLKFEHALDEAS